MEKILIKNLTEFSKDNGKFNCKIGEEKLNGLENVLEIVNSNYCPIEEANFFEFGSAQYNVSTYTVRSAKHSHFMGFGTDLNYSCFDSYVEESDFDIVTGLMKAFNDAEKVNRRYSGLTVRHKDPIWKLAKNKFLSLDKRKDFSDNFARIRNKEYYEDFFGFYDQVDLEELKKGIKSFSIQNYSDILSKIESSDNPIIFSQQVLNCPNLSLDFPFWEIDKGFHVHRGNIAELMEELSVERDWIFRSSDGKRFNNRDIFLDKFKQDFSLENKKIELINNQSEYYLFWKP